MNMNITRKIVAATAIAIAASVGTSVAPAEAAPARVTIQGYAWEDTNRNGKVDAKEKRLAKKSVTLLNSKGRIVRKTYTNSSGKYAFTNLPRGTYTVRTNLDNFTGTTLVGPKKSINNARTVRTYKTNFKKSTWVSFGFYNSSTAIKPPAAPSKPKPVVRNTPGNLNGWNSREVDFLEFVNGVRKSMKLKALSADTGLHKNAREAAMAASTDIRDAWGATYWDCVNSSTCTVAVVTSKDNNLNDWVWYSNVGDFGTVLKGAGYTKVGYAVVQVKGGKPAFAVYAEK